jgi:hypothetical protein
MQTVRITGPVIPTRATVGDEDTIIVITIIVITVAIDADADSLSALGQARLATPKAVKPIRHSNMFVRQAHWRAAPPSLDADLPRKRSASTSSANAGESCRRLG